MLGGRTSLVVERQRVANDNLEHFILSDQLDYRGDITLVTL
jgi:hypothetical protein